MLKCRTFKMVPAGYFESCSVRTVAASEAADGEEDGVDECAEGAPLLNALIMS